MDLVELIYLKLKKTRLEFVKPLSKHYDLSYKIDMCHNFAFENFRLLLEKKCVLQIDSLNKGKPRVTFRIDSKSGRPNLLLEVGLLNSFIHFC